MTDSQITYASRYGELRDAWVTDTDYDEADLWEGVDYTAVDIRSELVVVLRWDDIAGWVQRSE